MIQNVFAFWLDLNQELGLRNIYFSTFLLIYIDLDLKKKNTSKIYMLWIKGKRFLEKVY